jgi:Zn-dependent peptidase ImmA (M78 family)/DNA-binding XRE family transcriptional regulator
MTNLIQKLAPEILGERLRVARETAKVTQDVAAKHAGVARTTLVAIEKGQRDARIDELQALAHCYGVSVNALLRQEAIHVDLVPRFRRLAESDEPGVDAAAQLLNDLVRAEVELENALGIKRERRYPAELTIQPGDVKLQAESDANDLRKWLGLGDAPIQDLFSILDMQLGIRVYVRNLAANVSGLFAFDEAVGACMLINASHRRDRRTQTGGHETGHFIGTRRQPEVYRDEKYENSRDERYANAFGAAFLTPANSVRLKFKEITAGSSHLTRRHIILLAHFFGVSRQAIVYRLEDLGLTKKGTWEWFEDNGGISDQQAAQVLGDAHLLDSMAQDSLKPVSMRLYGLATEAWKRNLVSEEQVAEMLKLSRIEVRDFIESAEAEEEEVYDLFKLH